MKPHFMFYQWAKYWWENQTRLKIRTETWFPNITQQEKTNSDFSQTRLNEQHIYEIRL